MSRLSALAELSPEYPFLGLIAIKSMHGYELHQRLSNELGFVWQVSQSQAYAILGRLETKGDIYSDPIQQTGLPVRHHLRLTPQGKQRFTEWLYLPSPCTPRHIRMEFVTKLYFLTHFNPNHLTTAIQSQRLAIQSRLYGLNQTLLTIAADDHFRHLSLSMRINQLNALMTWLNDCENKLKK